MLQLDLRITASPRGVKGMIQALKQVMLEANLQRGCVHSQLYAQVNDTRSLLYTERWETRADFDHRIRSRRFGALLAIMETAREAPCLDISTVSEQRGLDYIETVRLEPGQAGPAQGAPAE